MRSLNHFCGVCQARTQTHNFPPRTVNHSLNFLICKRDKINCSDLYFGARILKRRSVKKKKKNEIKNRNIQGYGQNPKKNPTFDKCPTECANNQMIDLTCRLKRRVAALQNRLAN